MAGCSTDSACADVKALAASGSVGAVILMGTSYRSSDRIRALTRSLQKSAGSAPGLFVATDQEGGQVQRLQGSGFDRIPAATVQGRWSIAQLQQQAQLWGGQLNDAGINLNLSPVLDTVPPALTATNEPIGRLHREFGTDPHTVESSGTAVVDGYTAAGVDVAVKHFPGLGRVHGNTDSQTDVHDTVTGPTSAYLEPFRAAIEHHVAFVMVSTAYYDKIDRTRPAAFSSSVITGLLRGKLGFRAVVISDDLANAAQVRSVDVGQRAVRFVDAGGDMVLTVDSSQVVPMAAAVARQMKSDPQFGAKVDASVRRILEAKLDRGLLP